MGTGPSTSDCRGLALPHLPWLHRLGLASALSPLPHDDEWGQRPFRS